MAIARLIRSILSSAVLSALAPLLIFALVAGLVRALGLARRRLPWVALSWATTLFVTATAVAYLFLPVLFEDAETDIACVSALAMRGQPIYPAMDAAQRYILLYGPITYLAHIPFYWLFGQNLIAFKLLGVAALIVSLAGCYAICRGYASRRAAAVGLGCAALILFRYLGVEFWGRIDPLILMLTVLCVWAIVRGPAWLAVCVVAVGSAAIPNLKISGLAYLLPVFVLLAARRGWLPTAAAALLGATLFPLPFLLPAVSFANYLAILKVATGHGLVVNFLIRNIQYSVLLLLPVLVSFSRKKPSTAQAPYLLAIVFGLALTSILGSKSGAGSYHLIPYLVPILHLYFWHRAGVSTVEQDQAFRAFALAWAGTALFLASTHATAVLQAYRRAPLGTQTVAEVTRDQKTYRGRTLEIGIGNDFEDPRTRYGFLTVFDGQPYTVAGAAIRDLQAGGIPVPASTVGYLRECRTAVWLIPKNQVPFSASNSYFEAPHPAFDAPFRQAFQDRYRLTATGDLFNVWTCRP